MKKKGFGIIEGALAFTIFTIIFSVANGIIQYSNHPATKYENLE